PGFARSASPAPPATRCCAPPSASRSPPARPARRRPRAAEVVCGETRRSPWSCPTWRRVWHRWR
ncbi:unnamed protein product, partial [Effrenium voratum]